MQSAAVIRPRFPIDIHEVDARYDVKIEDLGDSYRVVGRMENVSEAIDDLDRSARRTISVWHSRSPA